MRYAFIISSLSLVITAMTTSYQKQDIQEIVPPEETKTHVTGIDEFDLNGDGINDISLNLNWQYGSSQPTQFVRISGLAGTEIAYFVDSVENWFYHPTTSPDTTYYFEKQDMVESYFSGESITPANLLYKEQCYIAYSNPAEYGYGKGEYSFNENFGDDPFYVICALNGQNYGLKLELKSALQFYVLGSISLGQSSVFIFP